MYNKDSLKKSTLAELRQIADNLKLEGYVNVFILKCITPWFNNTIKYISPKTIKPRSNLKNIGYLSL